MTQVPPRLPAGERLRRAGVAAWSIIGLLILLVVAGWALLKIRVIFPPLVLALLIIYLLNPIVSWLEARGIRRGIGAVATYVVAIAAITVLVMISIPFLSRQIRGFAEDLPEFRAEVVRSVEDLASGLEERLGVTIDTGRFSCLIGADEVAGVDAPSEARCDEVTRDLRERIAGSAGRITEIGLTLLEALLVFVLAPLLALYLLVDLPQVQRDFLNLMPENHRDEVADVGSKVGRAVGGFFRGQLLVALFVGVLSSLGFWLIGLPFWLVIGGIAGFTNLIPLVGPFIGGGLGFAVGTLTEGIALGLWAALVALVVQQIDNHVISPNVMKRTVNLHPVTVMLALLAGGALAGFWGILLAVPAVAVAKIILGHLWATRVLGATVSPYASAGASAEPPSVVPEEDGDQ